MSAVSDFEQKRELLRRRLADLPSLLVAYSGGVDSACLLYEAHRALGDKTLGVIADSPSLPRAELEEAVKLSQEFALPLRVIRTAEMENPDYAKNPLNRCFFCKAELFEKLRTMARQEGWAALAYGENASDVGDFRPGRDAAQAFQVLSPLREAGLTKADIRRMAREANLPVADKPASPCLSSRIPHGQEVTEAKLKQIERAEGFLLARGYDVVRVRHHGKRAVIQVAPPHLPRVQEASEAEAIDLHLRTLGFEAVEIDPQGYRGPSLSSELAEA